MASQEILKEKVLRQTVVLRGGKVFLREGWYDYGSLVEVLEAAGKLTKKQRDEYTQTIVGTEEKKKRATK